MTHNEIAFLCREQITAVLGLQDKDIPLMPFDQLIYNFAESCSHAPKELNIPQIRLKFRKDVLDGLLTMMNLLRPEVHVQPKQWDSDTIITIEGKGTKELAQMLGVSGDWDLHLLKDRKGGVAYSDETQELKFFKDIRDHEPDEEATEHNKNLR